MRDGRLAQVGTPKQVYDAPADLDVARFVGGAVVLPAVVSGTGATSVLGTLSVADGVAQGPVEVLVRPEQIILTPSAPGTSADAAPGAVPLVPGASRAHGHRPRGAATSATTARCGCSWPAPASR